jgi:hypothetical protein
VDKQAGCTPALATDNKKADTVLKILNLNIISTSFQLAVATYNIYTRLEIKSNSFEPKGSKSNVNGLYFIKELSSN